MPYYGLHSLPAIAPKAVGFYYFFIIYIKNPRQTFCIYMLQFAPEYVKIYK